MNLNLFRCDGQWIMVDCGISFADIYLPGIDLIMPKIDYIRERREDLLAIVLTHAHEDHIGAVARLWPELQCPVVATPFTMRLVKSKFAEAGLLDQVPFIEVPLEEQIQIGKFDIEFVTLTHSIPEPNALLIKTAYGNIFHTGDWKFDDQPLLGASVDYDRLREIGDQGVKALICDSTNVFSEGRSGSEGDVREGLFEVINPIKGRVFVTTFASNIARLQTIGQVAKETGRALCLIGRSLKKNVGAAKLCGYLSEFPDVIEEDDAQHLPKDQFGYIEIQLP